MTQVPKALDAESLPYAEDRWRRLLAALNEKCRGNQSELHRQLAAVEPGLSLSAVQAWCRGPGEARTGTPLKELTLRGILAVIGLPHDYGIEDDRKSSKPPRSL